MTENQDVKFAKIQLWCSILQSGAILITFVFLTIQTINANQSLEETRKALRSTASSKISDFITEVNLLLMEDDELRKLFPYSKSDLLAFILINNFSEWYHFRCEGQIQELEWRKYEDLIQMTSDLPWVKKVLQTYYSEYEQLHRNYKQYLVRKNILQYKKEK